LGGSEEARSVFSVRATFFVAFFGGGFASVAFTALNAQRLGRLRRDRLLLLFGALFFGGFYFAVGYATAAGLSLPVVGVLSEGERTVRTVGRILALGFSALAYLRHGASQRALNQAGRPSPSPWKAGLSCAALSVALSFSFLWLGAKLA
jgi:hypothetical protein